MLLMFRADQLGLDNVVSGNSSVEKGGFSFPHQPLTLHLRVKSYDASPHPCYHVSWCGHRAGLVCVHFNLNPADERKHAVSESGLNHIFASESISP